MSHCKTALILLHLKKVHCNFYTQQVHIASKLKVIWLNILELESKCFSWMCEGQNTSINSTIRKLAQKDTATYLYNSVGCSMLLKGHIFYRNLDLIVSQIMCHRPD